MRRRVSAVASRGAGVRGARLVLGWMVLVLPLLTGACRRAAAAEVPVPVLQQRSSVAMPGTALSSTAPGAQPSAARTSPPDATPVAGAVPQQPVSTSPTATAQPLAGAVPLQSMGSSSATASAHVPLLLGVDPTQAIQDTESALQPVRAAVGRKDFTSAAKDLEALLQADLPRFVSLWTTDAGLAPLRDSEPGRALAARLPRLEASWRTALTQGLPLVWWKPAAPRSEEGDDSEAFTTPPPALLRAGVYLPKQRRFVPTGPQEPGVILARLSVDRASVLLVRGTLGLGLTSMLTDLEVSLRDAVTGNPTTPVRSPAPDYRGPEALQWSEARGKWAFRVQNGDQTNPTLPQFSGWRDVATDGNWRNRSGPVHGELISEGSVLLGLPDGWVREGKMLVEESTRRSIPHNTEPAKHRFLQAVTVGDTLWLSAVESWCDASTPEPTSILRHVVERITRDNKRVRVHEGPGGASLMSLGEGGLIVQVDKEARRFPASVTTWKEATALPEGVLLTTPLQPKVCHSL
ncbi:hypothetical protein [Myxococcus qinghaiensis]|uniref:hypothetical protein n=1 Tax=Myxococcus qinghaiensis TaxID=2906758 RepID=UPI0020A76B9D|nr:hypothetical protein [Myxococcus qinghaiensis]MCP3166963.1 hypothetical protein [Myxococcus qinghaiensis]